MSGNDQQDTDPRRQRTQAALLQAFHELVLSGEEREIRVADIIRRADVGRSTFYEHYANAGDLHLQALAGPMSILADAITSRDQQTRLQSLLDHFDEFRPRARRTFTDATTRDQVAGLLTQQVDERLRRKQSSGVVPDLLPRQLAESALALIRVWLCDEVTCSSAELAAAICRSSQLLLDGLKLSD